VRPCRNSNPERPRRPHDQSPHFGCRAAVLLRRRRGRRAGRYPVRVRGTIDAVDAKTMQVTSREARRSRSRLHPMSSSPRSSQRTSPTSSLAAISGTAAMPQADGSLRAYEIQVFPNQCAASAKVTAPMICQPQSTMTNGTVGDVVVTQGRTLTLALQGWREAGGRSGKRTDHHLCARDHGDAGCLARCDHHHDPQTGWLPGRAAHRQSAKTGWSRRCRPTSQAPIQAPEAGNARFDATGARP